LREEEEERGKKAGRWENERREKVYLGGLGE